MDRSGRDPHARKPLGLGLVLAVLGLAIAALFAALQAEQLAYALVLGVGAHAAQEAVSRDPGALALAQLAGLALPIVLATRLSGETLRAFLARALAPCPWDRVLAALVAGIALQLPLVELTHWLADAFPSLAHTAEQEARLREAMRIDSLYAAICVPLAVVVLAPLTEELLFRALAQRDLAERWSAAVAIPAVALLFAAFHLDVLGAPFIFLAGLALGVLAERWRSARISIAMHAGVNAVPALLSADVLPIAGLNTDDDAHVAPLLVVGSGVVFIIAFGLAVRAVPAERPPPPSDSLGN